MIFWQYFDDILTKFWRLTILWRYFDDILTIFDDSRLLMQMPIMMQMTTFKILATLSNYCKISVYELCMYKIEHLRIGYDRWQMPIMMQTKVVKILSKFSQNIIKILSKYRSLEKNIVRSKLSNICPKREKKVQKRAKMPVWSKIYCHLSFSSRNENMYWCSFPVKWVIKWEE